MSRYTNTLKYNLNKKLNVESIYRYTNNKIHEVSILDQKIMDESVMNIIDSRDTYKIKYKHKCYDFDQLLSSTKLVLESFHKDSGVDLDNDDLKTLLSKLDTIFVINPNKKYLTFSFDKFGFVCKGNDVIIEDIGYGEEIYDGYYIFEDNELSQDTKRKNQLKILIL